jgi:hypothetical protein
MHQQITSPLAKCCESRLDQPFLLGQEDVPSNVH